MNEEKANKVISEFEDEYDSLISELDKLKYKRLNSLKNKFYDKLESKLTFKRGDIIHNVTGMIKLDSFEFVIGYNGRGEQLPTRTIFKGIKYKWVKGGFVTRTKNKEIGEISYLSTIKRIDSSKVILQILINFK